MKDILISISLFALIGTNIFTGVLCFGLSKDNYHLKRIDQVHVDRNAYLSMVNDNLEKQNKDLVKSMNTWEVIRTSDQKETRL